jgi:Putative polyhydroxyalkanoic acid system protein (PHA_gran_rgn)
MAKTFEFHVSHALPRAEARARMEKLTAAWSRHGVQSTWNGDEARLDGKVLGMHLVATLRVTDSQVGGEASDPGLLLRGQAKKYLTEKFAHYLDPTKSLAQL